MNVEKSIACETAGDLKKALGGVSDDTKFSSWSGENKYFVRILKITKDFDRATYDEEKNEAKYEGRKPNFMRVIISEDDF